MDIKHEQELKKMLADSWELNAELVGFIKQCFREIFPDKYAYAYLEFDRMLEFRHNYGCIQSLDYIYLQLKKDKV